MSTQARCGCIQWAIIAQPLERSLNLNRPASSLNTLRHEIADVSAIRWSQQSRLKATCTFSPFWQRSSNMPCTHAGRWPGRPPCHPAFGSARGRTRLTQSDLLHVRRPRLLRPRGKRALVRPCVAATSARLGGVYVEGVQHLRLLTGVRRNEGSTTSVNESAAFGTLFGGALRRVGSLCD